MRAPIHAYLATQASWFFGFGLQTSLFPYVATQILGVGDARLGLAQATLTAPALALLLVAGVIAERRDRRTLLIGLHAAATIPALGLAAVVFNGAITYPLLLIYGLTMGVIGAIMMPTRDAALNAVVDHQGGLTVQRGVVLSSLVQFLAQIAGMAAAAAAGAAMVRDPIAGLIVLQGAVVALGGLAAWRLPRLPAIETVSSTSVLQDLRDGLGVVWASPVIRPMALAMGAVGVFVVGGGFLVLLPAIVTQTYDGGLTQLGVVFMAFWSGAAAATASLAKVGHIARPGRTLAVSFAVGAGAFAGLLIDLPFWGFAGLVALWGATAGIGIAMSRAIVQEAAPPEALARVLSIYQLGFMGGAPIGAIAIGVVSEMVGTRVAAIGPMLGVATVALWLGMLSPIGALRAEDPASRR